MEHVNGSAKKWAHLADLFPDMREEMRDKPEAEKKSENKIPGNPPAKEFLYGSVLTRVWANPNHWGEISWRVDQVRLFSAAKSGFTRNFWDSDLQDAIRGLFFANKWIKRTERKRRRRWFW